MLPIDDIYRQLGNPGRYHVMIYILLCLNYFPIVLKHLNMAIFGAKTPHRCLVPSGVLQSENGVSNYSYNGVYNSTGLAQRNDTDAYEVWSDSVIKIDSCEVTLQTSEGSNVTESCHHGWAYTKNSEREWNIVMEVRFELLLPYRNCSSVDNKVYNVALSEIIRLSKWLDQQITFQECFIGNCW